MTEDVDLAPLAAFHRLTKPEGSPKGPQRTLAPQTAKITLF
ncbi:hypothetical protein ABT294_47310 [Nonomuraea sp. NPDC000554]